MPQLWGNIIKIYLAGTMGRQWLFDNDLKIPLNKINLLESFLCIQKWQIDLIPYLKSFILDSGAFSFMNGKKSVDFNKLVIDYGNFIKKHDIKNFIELDIDNIIGVAKYEYYRKLLQDITGKNPIPVMHRRRGKDYFYKIIEENNYIALGGLAIGDIKKGEYNYLKWFIDKTHEKNKKIHGLGFTPIKWIKKLNFDSVDSTTWLSFQRYGRFNLFINDTMKPIQKRKGFRVKSTKDICKSSFEQWLLFAIYMEERNERIQII